MKETEVTRLLASLRSGREQALPELLSLLYEELRRMARQAAQKAPPGVTIEPTALVHEAYLRLVGDAGWENRRHFFFAAARAMRDILVEEARRKAAQKRGGGWQRSEPADFLALETPVEDVRALDAALGKLEQEDPDQARIVQLRFFAGLDQEEIALALGISTRTVQREWRHARARLYRELRR